MRLTLLVSALVLVTPLAGVWIEILANANIYLPSIVTPLAGVWIEIS